MGIKYSSFTIRGTDVSQFNGVIDWTNMPANFSGIRVGYGRTIDSKFYLNWMNSKGKVNRLPYWYMDYYNNHISTHPANGMSDEQWGIEQANTCWSVLKNDPSGIIMLDIESTNGGYAPKIQEVRERVLTIAKYFLIRMDELNGKKNGIYCSLGLLSWFDEWFKDRPLWVAWYTYRYVNDIDASDVIYAVNKQGWKVKPIIWQYASDGMVNDDGIKMGKSYFRTQMDDMDLNGWVGTNAQYEDMFGAAVVITDPTPDDETEVIPVTNTRTIPVMSVIRPVSLRKQPVIKFTTFITLIPVGTKLDCLEKKIEGNNIWQRVGINQWVAEVNNGIQYLK